MSNRKGMGDGCCVGERADAVFSSQWSGKETHSPGVVGTESVNPDLQHTCGAPPCDASQSRQRGLKSHQRVI